MTTPNNLPEKVLLQRISEGNEHAFRVFVNDYASSLYTYLRVLTFDPSLAEELVQDIFLKIWLTRENLPHVRNIKAYLFVLSRNQAINAVKSIARQKKKAKAWQNHVNLSKDGEPEEEWKFNLIDEAIAALPSQQKNVWVMSRKKGMRVDEIARTMNLTRSTVKKYLRLAIAAILRYVKERTMYLFF